MSRIHIDFETRSVLNVRDTGAWTYSVHPQTSIMCFAYCVDNQPVVLVTEQDIEQHRDTLNRLAEDPNNLFVAHNALFEQCIWGNIMVPRYGFTPIPLQQWRCTAAKAAYMSLPRNLEGAAKQAGLVNQKDTDGGKAMLKLTRPRRNGEFWTYENAKDDFDKMYAYCVVDVETERELDKKLPDLSPREQKIWFADQRINLNGVRLDVAGIKTITAMIEQTKKEMGDAFVAATGGWVQTPSQVKVFSEWLSNNGVPLPNLQAATVDAALQGELPDNVREALTVRRSMSKISTSKYEAMLDRVDSRDGRLRDLYMYCGAITKRWAGRGVQLQNLPRGTVNSTTAWVHVSTGDYQWVKSMYPDLMGMYSSCIRGAITATPGNRLLCADFSSIEAVMLAWVAGQKTTLDIFSAGGCMYCHEATRTFGYEVNKKDHPYERQVGKVEVLALGYAGGVGAFGTMATSYNVSLMPAYSNIWDAATEDEQINAEIAYERYVKRATKSGALDILDEKSGLVADIIKQRWRLNNPNVVRFWYDLENAAIEAVRTGTKQYVGGHGIQPQIVFGMHGTDLLCRLPSGTCLVYRDAKVGTTETDFGPKTALTYNVTDERTFQYRRTLTYGGKLCENIVQALARDVQADAIVRLTDAGFCIVVHTHDENVADEPTDSGRTLEEFTNLMAEVPVWASGLPVRVEGWEGFRYRK